MNGPRSRFHAVLNRGTGIVLVLVAGGIGALAVLAPIPGFEELEARSGVVVEARRERFSPCRRGSGDCTRTMVTVRHGDAVRDYHFGDIDTAAFEAGEPITVWTHPHLRGTDQPRVWHAEQGGRVLREYAAEARSDRRIRGVLVTLMPFLLVAGAWITGTYDGRGRRVR